MSEAELCKITSHLFSSLIEAGVDRIILGPILPVYNYMTGHWVLFQKSSAVLSLPTLCLTSTPSCLPPFPSFSFPPSLSHSLVLPLFPTPSPCLSSPSFLSLFPYPLSYPLFLSHFRPVSPFHLAPFILSPQPLLLLLLSPLS